MVFDKQTWDAWQKAAASGHIRYLYRFTIHGRVHDSVIGYCTGSDAVTFDGQLYAPYPCVHESIKKSAEDAETSINLAANKLWLTMLFINNPRKLTVDIIRYRTELLDGQVIFRGVMRERTLEVNVIKLNLGSVFASGSSNMITYYTQRYCNHSQYGRFCGLKWDDWCVELPPGAFELDTLKTIRILDPDKQLNMVNEYWQQLILIYTVKVEEGGYEFSYEQDNLASIVMPDRIGTKYPMSAVTDLGSPIVIAPNCGLSLTRCRTIFGNLPRACAWPDMPMKNFAAIDATQQGQGEGSPQSIPGKHPQR